MLLHGACSYDIIGWNLNILMLDYIPYFDNFLSWELVGKFELKFNRCLRTIEEEQYVTITTQFATPYLFEPIKVHLLLEAISLNTKWILIYGNQLLIAQYF